MNAHTILHLILWPPLIGFLINGIFGRSFPKALISFIACFMPLLSFVGTVIAYMQFKNIPTNVVLYFWFLAEGAAKVNFEFYIDNLSLLMLFIVTGVGTLIHVYSSGYMHSDAGFHRYFAYLNLFLFSMLLLVLGSNLVVIFAGWEGVGLCSFLLIGFWYSNADYNRAANKAFIMNRIGDAGFILAMFLLSLNFGTLNVIEIFESLQNDGYGINQPLMIGITLLLFLGVCGKSAQIPLFTWLPDAMAGPTPVSALIHAATMVTAGIYLVARTHVLFELCPVSLQVIAAVGLATAFVGALIALKQHDIKKILAYSTVSQLGYMVVALGVGAYMTAMFHVMTHAFFKALLFLAAGSVIHGLSGEQDIRKMGAIKQKMQWTHMVFLIGTLAIIGCPPLAGFFSKDEIMAAVFSRNVYYFSALAAISVLSAWYMLRLYFSTFYGEYRGEKESWHRVHESPAIMVIPLVVLAVLSIVGGFAGTPDLIYEKHFVYSFLQSVILQKQFHVSHSFEYSLWAASAAMLVAVAFITYKRYARRGIEDWMSEPKSIGQWVSNKLYVDELYQVVIVKPLYLLGQWFGQIFENAVIDRCVRTPAKLITGFHKGLQPLHSGNIGWYLLSLTIGLVLFLFMFIHCKS